MVIIHQSIEGLANAIHAKSNSPSAARRLQVAAYPALGLLSFGRSVYSNTPKYVGSGDGVGHGTSVQKILP